MNYATFIYGDGTLYGAVPTIPIDELILSLKNTAFDTIEIHFSAEFVVNPAYTTVTNYSIINVSDDTELAVRKVVVPNGVVHDKVVLTVDRLVPGQTYEVTLSNIVRRDGATLVNASYTFKAHVTKADNMLSNLPGHFNTELGTSSFRQILHALAASDDLIGGI
jgi:hypothetical protein